jgi:hypothetical protein
MKNVFTFIFILITTLSYAQGKILDILTKDSEKLTAADRKKLKNIITLKIPFPIKEIPVNLNKANCPNLRALVLTIEMAEFPDKLLEFDNLDALNLVAPKLKKLNLSAFKQLRGLRVDANELTHLTLTTTQFNFLEIVIVEASEHLESFEIEAEKESNAYPSLNSFSLISNSNSGKDIRAAGNWSTIFKKCTFINELSLVRVANAMVPKDISGLIYLKKLTLLSKDLVEVPEWINKLSNLEDLSISAPIANMQIKTQNLQNLNKLTITNEKLSVFPSFITSLDGLKDLTISAPIKDFPEYFSDAQKQKLEKLKINSEKLTVFPSFITSLDGLKDLTIVAPINDFSEHFSDVQKQKLENLSISNSLIHTFPLAILDLKNLKILNFGAPVKEIPTALSTLRRIKNLHLFCDSLSIFPLAVTSLDSLETLTLYAPVTISEEIVGLKRLRLINLKNKNLHQFPLVLGQMKSLTEISIAAPITEIPASLPNLKKLTLRLNDTEITDIPKNIVKKIGYLMFWNSDDHKIPKGRVEELEIKMKSRVNFY